MKTRVIVIAACIGVVLAAIALVAANWPALPARTLPKPATYVPLGGQAAFVPHAGCLAPMIAELRKRPSWMLRLDDMRWTDYTGPDEDPRHASIFVDASGATWHSAWLSQQTLPLTADELRDVIAAFDLICDVDESIPNNGFEGRYINVAYGKTEKAAARLDYNAPITLRLGELFDAIRARYVANRAGATKQLVMKLTGQIRSGPDEWTKYAIEIDASKINSDDESRVGFVDWALALPHALPKGQATPRMTATGTFTMDGITRKIAVNLDRNAPENAILQRTNLAQELTMWMSINRE